jgi:cell division septation protein DedD
VLTEVPLIARTRPSQTAARFKAARAWVYMAAAVLVVVLVLWSARPKRSPAHPTPAKSTIPAADVQYKAWETRTLPPADAATRRPKPEPARTVPAPPPSRPEPVPAKSGSGTINGPVWRVVLYTYAREEDAQKKARTLNAKQPRLDAHVFSPNGKGLYLVTAGEGMSREDAVRIRKQALSIGMPHDSYIQNYRQ